MLYKFLQNQNVVQLYFGLTFGLCIVSAVAVQNTVSVIYGCN